MLSNLQENKWNGKHKDLAKVLFCDKLGLILVMEKATVIRNTVNWNCFKCYIERKYKNDNLRNFMISDCKPSNWGFIGKRLVKIDYGN